MTLKELEQQIVSEAVKDFRWLFVMRKTKIPGIKESVSAARIESFLISTLHQATQRVAEETIINVLNIGGSETDFSEDDWKREQNARSWLNHNSEEGK